MSATDEVSSGLAPSATRRPPPGGTLEHLVRWTSTALVLTVGVSLLTIPGLAESGVTGSGVGDSPSAAVADPELRLVRLAAGASLILLVLVREMFVWFGARRS